MDEIETDRERIGESIDVNGDVAPARKPIENPGASAGGAPASEDPLLEPHPDEPGVKSNGESRPVENPSDAPAKASGDASESPTPGPPDPPTPQPEPPSPGPGGPPGPEPEPPAPAEPGPPQI